MESPLYRIVTNIDCEHHEAGTNDSQTNSLNTFAALFIHIGPQSPEQDRSRRNLDETVATKADKRKTSSDKAGDDRDQTFKAVVAMVKYSRY